MNFDDIPTPETDAYAARYYQPKEAVHIPYKRVADLEKRLAMARLALTPFANYACDEPHVGEPKCHNCIARDVLALTAPKV